MITGQEVKWFREVDVFGGRGGIVTSVELTVFLNSVFFFLGGGLFSIM